MELAAGVTGGGGRVLLVDDDAQVRETTSSMLLSAGCRSVIAAADGPGALAIAESGAEFDVLVTDLVMAQMDGVELASRLRALRPELPVLFISGYSADILGDDAPLVRSTYLPKPFSVGTLRAELGTLLDEAAAG